MAAAESTTITITKETAKRLLFDIKSIMKAQLEEQGIYYKHSEDNILEGYALIIGPPDSLYENGFFIFKLKFPEDYPHSPPALEYLTNDQVTRFHPNLYKNSRVCIDILNTWRGERWSGCQSISSVLLTIASLLDKRPLLHEPGVTPSHSDYEKYNRVITYKTLDFAVYAMLTNFKAHIKIEDAYSNHFYEIMKAHYRKTEKEIINKIQMQQQLQTTSVYYTISLYDFGCKIDYAELLQNFQTIDKKE